MRKYAKIDDNQPDIVDALRKAGARVLSLASVGNGCPDLLVGAHGKLILMEIKDGSKSPSERKLTPMEISFFNAWKGYEVHKVENVEQALAAIG